MKNVLHNKYQAINKSQDIDASIKCLISGNKSLKLCYDISGSHRKRIINKI